MKLWQSIYISSQIEYLHSSHQGFQVNDKVLASWSDCRFYPAKVISVNKDGEYWELKWKK